MIIVYKTLTISEGKNQSKDAQYAKSSWLLLMKNNGNLLILECNHYVHLDCMKMHSQKQYMDSQIVKWAVWADEVTMAAINSYFGVKFVEDLNEELLKIQILQDSNMIQCTCKNFIEVVPGSVDYKQKDDEGRVISRQAAEHMAEFRVRCNICSRVFWSKCNTEPYHLGKTWQEFDDYRGADKCRFWLDKLKKIRKNWPPAFRAVCDSSECERNMQNWCKNQLACGHFWGGTANEDMWPPCLDPDCVSRNPGMTLEQTGDDYCIICYTGGLSQSPCLQLDCKHIFHADCLIRVIKDKWSGPRINFQFTKCPSCKTTISWFHKETARLIRDALALEKNIEKMALQRAKHEGIDKDDRLKDPPYSGDLQSYAVARLSYYMCFKWKNPYFGGLKSWENNQQQNAEKFKPEELVWAAWSADAVGGGIKDCKLHGRDYIEFKWKFCCRVAQWLNYNNKNFIIK